MVADCAAAPSLPFQVQARSEAPGWPEAAATLGVGGADRIAPPILTQLQHRVITTYAVWNETCGHVDHVRGTPATASADLAQRTEALAYDRALEAFTSYRPTSPAELAEKCAFLAREECGSVRDASLEMLNFLGKDALHLADLQSGPLERARPTAGAGLWADALDAYLAARQIENDTNHLLNSVEPDDPLQPDIKAMWYRTWDRVVDRLRDLMMQPAPDVASLLVLLQEGLWIVDPYKRPVTDPAALRERLDAPVWEDWVPANLVRQAMLLAGRADPLQA